MQITARSSWRPIPVGSGFEDGINFYDDISEELVNHALRTLHWSLEQRGTTCWCLKFDDNDCSSFVSYGDAFIPGSPMTKLTARVKLQHVVEDTWTWPPLAIREGTSAALDVYPPDASDLLRRASWQAAIRIQRGDEYAGYLKLVGLDGSPPPDDRDLLAAAYQTKLEIIRLLAYQRVNAARGSNEFKARMHTTVGAIGRLPADDWRLAFRHIGDMLTSHLGAGWNRAACYWPIGDALECVWAQGGDGDYDWCCRVQDEIRKQASDIDCLIANVHSNPLPRDDKFLSAAAWDRRLIIDDIDDPRNPNILAMLWQANGDVRRIPGDYQRWEREGPVAAEFDETHCWVEAVRTDRPSDPIFVSKNGLYFVVPWFSRDKLIALWVLDMAYWSQLRAQPDAPSFRFTNEILDALGPAMDAIQVS